MKLLRWVVAAVVVLYVAWIAFPGVRALVAPEASAPPAAMRAEGPAADPGALDVISAPSLQGETAAAAIQSGNAPIVSLWGAAIVLYLLAAFLFANGNMRAMLAYAAAFAADAALTVIGGGEGGSLFDRVIGALAVGDWRWFALGGALLIGLTMLAAGKPNRRPA
ncbi:MAG TPA: hypothetical protein VD929_00750 [Caulobacteraceae bacterium]|nr:hypothetical protein [Caulobacteraceae bacterium]